MTTSRNIILWIEDRPNTVQWEKSIIEEKGYRVEFRYMPHDIRNFLTRNSDNVVAIIVDVMLRGVPNLDSIGKLGFPTDHGLEAGWTLIDHFLRSEESLYKELPILILSTKQEDTDDQQNLGRLRSKGGGSLHYIQKQGLNARNDFTKWVGGLNSSKLSEKD
jgi:CheY-like chemotaxis protein